jgi:hypothetical protein
MNALKPIVLLAAASIAAISASQGRPRTWWGIDAGVYIPTSSEIRDAFGDGLFKFGLRPFENRITRDWKFTTDITILTARGNGNRLLAVPITFGFTRSFGDPDAPSVPFFQIAAGPAYFDYSIEREVQVQGPSVQRVKDRKWGSNVNAELGVLFNRRLAVSLRGDWYSETDDFDFSGVSLTLSYAAFRW